MTQRMPTQTDTLFTLSLEGLSHSIQTLLCFDIHASDGGVWGCVCPRFAESLTHRPHGVKKYRTR